MAPPHLRAAALHRRSAPVDVYLLLNASDFVAHDLDRASVFAGCDAVDGSELEE